MTTQDLVTYAAVAAAVGSELLALNPRWRANSWIQLVVGVLMAIGSQGQGKGGRGRRR
jgi:hypothetical protein